MSSNKSIIFKLKIIILFYLTVFCKNTPLEFASFSSSKTLLIHDFPSACKIKGQRFACVLANDNSSYLNSKLKDANTHEDESIDDNTSVSSNMSIDSGLSLSTQTNSTTTVKYPGYDNTEAYNDVEAPRNIGIRTNFLKPMFITEISSVVEILAVSLTQVDALRFALVEMNEDSLSNLEQDIYSNVNNSSHTQKNNEISRLSNASVFAKTNSNHHQSSIKYRLSKAIKQNSDLTLCVFPLYEW